MKKIFKILIVIIFIIVVISFLGIINNDGDNIGKFNDENSRNLFLNSYKEVLSEFPTGYTEGNINTSYGEVKYYHYVNDDDAGYPILLIPGRFSGSPMWIVNINGLIEQKSVILIDVLGDTGLSTQSQEIKDSKDQALWLDEFVNSLDLDKVNIVGHSFGGWLGANYLKEYPEKVNTAVLLEPVCVIKGLNLSFILKSIPASIKILPESFREGFLQDLSGEDNINYQDDSLAQMINYGTEYFNIKLPHPNTITVEELEKTNTPIFINYGEDDTLQNPQEIIEIANETENIETRIWKNGTHSLPMEFPEDINKTLLEFIKVNE